MESTRWGRWNRRQRRRFVWSIFSVGVLLVVAGLSMPGPIIGVGASAFAFPGLLIGGLMALGALMVIPSVK